MAMKAKHAFGALENIDAAKSAGKIDAYDILFVKNADGKPYVGWLDKDGNKVVVSNDEELAALESELSTKASTDEVEALENQMATKADVTKVEELESEITSKVDADTVQIMIEKYSNAVIEVVEF